MRLSFVSDVFYVGYHLLLRTDAHFWRGNTASNFMDVSRYGRYYNGNNLSLGPSCYIMKREINTDSLLLIWDNYGLGGIWRSDL